MRATQLEPILALVRRARARIRIQRMLDAACTALIPASGLALLGAHLSVSRAVVGVAGGIAILAVAGAVVAGAIAVAAARAIADEDVAGRLDQACGLEDRLRTALVFARIDPPGTHDGDADPAAFMRAAIADGVRIAAGPSADAVRATPFREPANGRAAALCTMLAAVLAGIGLPDLDNDVVLPPPPAEVVPVAIVDELAPGDEPADPYGYPRSEIDDLLQLAEAYQRKELLELGEELRALLEALERGELTKEQLLERLVRAEARLAQQLGDPGSASWPAGLSGRLADVHEAIARLETPRGKTELGDRLDRKPLDDEDRLRTLERRRPSGGGTTGTGARQPPVGASGRAHPLRPAVTLGRPTPEHPRGPGARPRPVHAGPAGPGGPNAGSTPSPGGVVANGPASGGALAARPGVDNDTGTGTASASSTERGGGRDAGRGTAGLVPAPPVGTRQGNGVVVHASGARDGATSTRTTIVAAASKGFASAPYRDVFARYRRTVEETLHGEKIPSSYRYFVKRYFWTIRPETRPE